MPRNKSQNQAGFTLIELLVVTAVIALLASIALVQVNQTKVKSIFAQRVQRLQAVAQALDLYYSDNGRYPTPSTFTPHRVTSFTGLYELAGYLDDYTILQIEDDSPFHIMLYYWNNPGEVPLAINGGGPLMKCIELKDGFVLMLIQFEGADSVLMSKDGGVTDTAYERMGGTFKGGTMSGSNCT